MTRSVDIKNDLIKTFMHIKERNDRCTLPLAELTFTKTQELVKAGLSGKRIGTLLSDNPDIVRTLKETTTPNNERLFFYLFELNKEGKATDLKAFIVIDLTTGEVVDCSKNIVTFH